MKSAGLYFSLCFATDSCYCNISYATVITHNFKKISIPDILLLNLTISLQGERNAQVNYKLLTTMAKKYWLLFEEKKILKSLGKRVKIINDCVDTTRHVKAFKNKSINWYVWWMASLWFFPCIRSLGILKQMLEFRAKKETNVAHRYYIRTIENIILRCYILVYSFS